MVFMVPASNHHRHYTSKSLAPSPASPSIDGSSGPLWAAALVGLLLGWAWRPRWAVGIVAPADPPQLASLDF
ncbi:hypothetical protein D1007_09129 [Hordeum vulgare]|nr:hypothetical protein D1007_09129 [Hordeum vulgare]